MWQRRTDLALESQEMHGEHLSGVACEETTCQNFPLTTVRITSQAGADALGKPVGNYHTLDLTGVGRREEGAFSRAIQALSGLLSPLLPQEGEVLVVGLGNRAITPDAVGPWAVDQTLVTRHLRTLAPEHFSAFRPVAALSAGVLGTTGIESGEVVQAVAGQIHPQAIVAIDALAARRVERLCATVQVSDTGIAPGSGVGNHRFALTEETLGVPVIAVGVPTVVEGATLCADLLESAGLPLPGGGEDLRQLPGGELFVTPRDIDQRVSDMARVIGRAVSLALQPDLTESDLESLIG